MQQPRQVTKQVIEVHCGLAKLVFEPWTSTGKDDGGTKPGVGFSIIPDEGATLEEIRHGGVISRDDARRLRDELEIFLKGFENGLNL